MSEYVRFSGIYREGAIRMRIRSLRVPKTHLKNQSATNSCARPFSEQSAEGGDTERHAHQGYIMRIELNRFAVGACSAWCDACQLFYCFHASPTSDA